MLLAQIKATVILFVAWFIWHLMEYYIQSGNLGRHRYFFVFQCYWEDIHMYFPGKIGRNNKIQFVKENLFPLIVLETTTISGKNHMWRISDIRYPDSINYNEQKILNCFNDVHGGGFNFYMKNVFVLVTLALIYF